MEPLRSALSLPCRSTFFSLLFLPIVILLFVGKPFPTQGQSAMMDECSGGTLYYIAFPDTTTNTYDSRFPAQLLRARTTAFSFYVYSPVSQKISVGRAVGPGKTSTISAGEIKEFDTEEIGVPLLEKVNTPLQKALKVQAEYPVIIYVYMLTAFGSDGWTAIPVESWGTEYYAAAWPGQVVRDIFPKNDSFYVAIPKEAPAEIMVIAAYDGTQVTIRPTADLAGCPTCKDSWQTFTLNAGEAWLVQSTVDTSLSGIAGQGDLGGTFIQSSKPIGVVSGNSRLMLNAGEQYSLAENAGKNMAMESIPPVNELGTEFVYTPVWDDRSLQPGRDYWKMRKGEYTRFFAGESGGTFVARLKDVGDSILNSSGGLEAGGIAQEHIDVQRSVNEARAYKTTRPAFGITSPEGVMVDRAMWPYSGPFYYSSSTFMVEMVPREQWTSFAPIFVPINPTKAKHYLNVVADTSNAANIYYRKAGDTLQPFPFNRGRIPGTDLVWGSISLPSAGSYFVEGKKGARFTGQVYGSYEGSEEFRAAWLASEGGSVEKGAIINGVSSLGPAEYEENIALMYAYPLAPSRCRLTTPDQYNIQTKQDCGEMTITVSGISPNPTGLRSIALLPDSSANAKLEFLTPSSSTALVSQSVSNALLRVVPVDPTKDGHGVVIVHDRTREGRSRVEYSYEVERIGIDSTKGVNFGRVQTKVPVEERSVTITNPLNRDLTVKSLRFLLAGSQFRITRTEPAFNWGNGLDSILLKSGETLKIWIDMIPAQEEKAFEDSLQITLGCTSKTVPVRSLSAAACLSIGDVDFGTVQKGRTAQKNLLICNAGAFPVAFYDSTATGGGNLVSWLEEHFGIDDNYRNVLRKTTLASGECLTIRVRFLAQDTGKYQTTARFWANTRECRDTSVWTAHVVPDSVSGVAGDEFLEGNALTAVTPNPTNGVTTIGFRLEKSAATTVAVYDQVGRLVAQLLDEKQSAGEHEVGWDGRGVSAGVYYVRIQSGEWRSGRTIILLR